MGLEKTEVERVEKEIVGPGVTMGGHNPRRTGAPLAHLPTWADNGA